MSAAELMLKAERSLKTGGFGLMCAQAIAEENRDPAVSVPHSPWRVAAVEALPGYRLKVRFLDGTEVLAGRAQKGMLADIGKGGGLHGDHGLCGS